MYQLVSNYHNSEYYHDNRSTLTHMYVRMHLPIVSLTDVDTINTTATTVIGVVNTTSNVQFGCQASGVPMVTDIVWNYPPHVTFVKQLQFSPDNSSVTASGSVVGRIEFSHTGLYRCTATNGVTVNTIVFRLIVKGKNCDLCIHICPCHFINSKFYT